MYAGSVEMQVQPGCKNILLKYKNKQSSWAFDVSFVGAWHGACSKGDTKRIILPQIGRVGTVGASHDGHIFEYSTSMQSTACSLQARGKRYQQKGVDLHL